SLGNPRDALTAQSAERVIGGTTDYLSPEQAVNDPLDARSDIYNLGGTFFTLLTGSPPYDGTTAEKLAQHQLSPPPNPCVFNSAVPPALNLIVARMMAKRPADRYRTAQEVAEALGKWRPAEPSATATPVPLTTSTVPVGASGWRIRVPAQQTQPLQPAKLERSGLQSLI